MESSGGPLDDRSLRPFWPPPCRERQTQICGHIQRTSARLDVAGVATHVGDRPVSVEVADQAVDEEPLQREEDREEEQP